MTRTLLFQETALDVIQMEGQNWLRGPQLGAALGFSGDHQKAIRTLYKRNAAEFTPEMTTALELPSAGGMQLTRIFSARGAALLAMLAKTDKAATFRAWVLDVLENRHEQSEEMEILRRFNTLLRVHLLAANPIWNQIERYIEAGYKVTEIARFTRRSVSLISRHHEEMKHCGVVASLQPGPKYRFVGAQWVDHTGHVEIPDRCKATFGVEDGDANV
jgi:prophage antirepressor-like protein